MSKVREIALEKYKKHPSQCWILGLFCGLLFVAFSFLTLAIFAFEIFLIPLLFLPLLFSCYLAHSSFSMNAPLTFKGQFKFFTLFFNQRFRSSFRFLFTFLISLLINVLLTSIFSLICISVLQHTNPGEWNEFYSRFTILMQSATVTIEDVNALINDFPNLFNVLLIGSYGVSFGIALIYFIYRISLNSLSIYIRMSFPQIAAPLCNAVTVSTTKLYRSKITKEYILLNWPLFVLLLVGYAGGITLAVFLKVRYDLIIGSGFIGAMTLMMFYAPFYFPNMEALFEHNIPLFEKTLNDTTKEFFDQLQQNISLNQETIDKLKDAFKKDENKDENKDDEK